jgi:hypothetical protein
MNKACPHGSTTLQNLTFTNFDGSSAGSAQMKKTATKRRTLGLDDPAGA